MTTKDTLSGINKISEDIWSSMVNIPVTLSHTPTQVLELAGRVTSSIQIVGCWHGAVRIDMGTELARRATASLIGVDPSELSHDDVRDAAGELANMTAGGIKELLPQPCQISLPTVVMGTDFEVSVPQGIVLYCSVFDTQFGEFSVTVIRGEEHGQLPSGQRFHHEKN
jgi:chemotaxis protein CheX